jgi:2-oxoisovalerate dehydrogenase E1 component alpha subunit
MEQVRHALKTATGELLPSIDTLFEDVYKDIPSHIEEQRQELKAHLRKYPDDYDLDKFANGKEFMTK